MYIKRRFGVALLCAISLGGLSSVVNAAPVSGMGSWETTLQPRDFDGDTNTAEGYYDSVANITWLANADSNGNMNFTSANAWAAGLDFGGIDDWRLPAMNPLNGSTYNYNYMVDGSTDFGHNISAPGTIYAGSTANELAHMYYNILGNLSTEDPVTGNGRSGTLGVDFGLVNTGPFANLTTFFYWTGKEDTRNPLATAAFSFHENSGQLVSNGQHFNLKSWAVHDGDVGVLANPGGNPVPVPAALWLFGSGLLALAGTARRRMK